MQPLDEKLKTLSKETTQFLGTLVKTLKESEKRQDVLLDQHGEILDDHDEELEKIDKDLIERFEALKSGIEEKLNTIKRGRDGKDGKDGKNGKDGEDGLDYILTEKDKREIASKITVPVIEKVKEVALANPDILPQYGDKIRDALELLKDDERLSMSAIKGLEEFKSSIESRVKRSAGHSGAAPHPRMLHPLTADGSTMTFTVPKSINAIVLCSDFPTILYENNGFTLNARRTQLTLTTTHAPSSGAQLLFDYTAMFNS